MSRQLLNPLSGAVWATALVFLAGCATTHEVTLDTLAKPNPDGVSYVLVAKDPAIRTDSLRHREAAALVRTALSGRGLYEAPPKVKPDLIVELEYGVGEPRVHREKRKEPVYEETPATIRTVDVASGTDANGNTIYTTRIERVPGKSRKVGEREYVVVTTTYEKHLRITARENTPVVEGRPPAEVWTIDATSEGENRDIRKHLPILLGASIDFIGEDTRGQKTIRLKDEDDRITFVRQGL